MGFSGIEFQTQRIDQRHIERRPAFDPRRLRHFTRARFTGAGNRDFVKHRIGDENFAVDGAQQIEPAGAGKSNDRRRVATTIMRQAAPRTTAKSSANSTTP